VAAEAGSTAERWRRRGLCGAFRSASWLTTSSGVACAPSWLTAKPAGAPSGALSRRAARLAAPRAPPAPRRLRGAGAQAPGAGAAERWEALEERLSRLARARQAELRRERRAREAQAASAVRAAEAAHAAAVAARAPAAAVSAAAARVRAEAARLGGRRKASAEADDVRGEALWHRYGEQPTFWFHRLGRGAQAPAPPMRAIEDPRRAGRWRPTRSAGSPAPGGPRRRPLRRRSGRPFAPRRTSASARRLMLAAVDKQAYA